MTALPPHAAIELSPDIRTIAVLCGFSVYDAPAGPKHRQLPPLERIEPVFQRLQALLASERFAAAKIQATTLLNLDANTLRDRLRDIRAAVLERPGVNMVVIWSGHGDVREKSFRLAARNTWDPIEYEDGLGLDEVLRQSGVARVATWTLLLDACYAGEGLADVLGAAHELLKSESGTLRGYGALCSTSPFEKARDSVLLETLVEVLTQGPSDAVRAYAEREGGGGAFNPFNRMLSLGELFEAVGNEYRASPGKFRNAEPWPLLGGISNPRVFPNPQFQERLPSRLAETAYRPIARAADLESHFFPRALGIENLEAGWHFAGRVEVTRAILDWIARSPLRLEDRLCVVCADGGTGKSALLGRLVALTDTDYRVRALARGWNEVHDVQAGTVPPPGCIDAALSLRNLSAQTFAEQLAPLLSQDTFKTIEDFVGSVVRTYRRSDGTAPFIVLDALDEALEPEALVYRIIHPLVQAGWKLLVATRRSAAAKGARNLVESLGPATVHELDRDSQSQADIYAYSQGRLQRHAGLAPLANDAAQLIAERAGGKFLYARMATSSLLRRAGELPTLAELPSLLALDATEALTQEFSTLDREFQHHFVCEPGAALAMLTALSWGQGDGVPLRDGIWAAMAQAVCSLKGPALTFEERHLLWVLREAGRFIQESGDGEQAVYRLFHQSLVDHFQGNPLRSDPVLDALDERIAQALIGRVRAARDWATSNPYLVRHMPAHFALRLEQRGLNALLVNLDWIEARLKLSGIQALLSDYRLCHDADPATGRLQRTLSMVTHILGEYPEQLIPQLLGRITPGVPDITPLLESRPGANYSLPAPFSELAEDAEPQNSRRPWLPGLNVDQKGVDLRHRTLALDGLLARAREKLHLPHWIAELGGLRQAGALVFTLRGHSATVNGVAMSSDDATIVSGGYDGLRLWNARNGQFLRTLQGHEQAVTGVALSTDGRIIASASADKTLGLWTANGQLLHTIRGHEDEVTSVAISADGRTLVSGSDDRTVRVWDVESGQLRHRLSGHSFWVKSVALSADGRTIASGSTDHTICLWNAESGALLRTLEGHENQVSSVALSVNGDIVVSGSQDGTVRIWDASNGHVLHKLQVPEEFITCVALSADGRVVATGDTSNSLRLWDAIDGRNLRTLRGHEQQIASVAISANGRTIVSGGMDNKVRLWDAASEEPLSSTHTIKEKIRSLATSADGRTITSADDSGAIWLWDAASGRALRTPIILESIVINAAISADGRLFVSSGWDEAVQLWDAASGQVLRTMNTEGQYGKFNSVALSADGHTIVTGDNDGTVALWNAENGDALHILAGHENRVNSVALSANGTVATGSDDKSVRLWCAATGQLLSVLRGHEERINSVVLSADGGTIVSGSDDKTLRLWNTKTCQAHTLHGHAGPVTCVALSAEGRTIVSGSEDTTVRVWDAVNGRLLETLSFDATIQALSLVEVNGKALLVVASGRAIVRLTRQSSATVSPTALR